jgi:hypothetical protein
MKPQPLPRRASEAGYTLITTMVLTLAAAVLMAGTLQRSYSGSKLNDRNNAYISGTAAAEAATEKTMARMMVDFASGGEATLSNNITYYETQLLPTASENSYWTNFVFSDGQGHPNQIYVARTTTNANPPYIELETQYPGLYAFASTYRVIANATPSTTTGTSEYYNFTNAVCQDVQMAEIPVFQYAIFYNGLLEFSDCATLTINGRVQCNSNIYIGTPSSSILTFNYMVTASGTITNPANVGMTQSEWSGTTKYNGSPSPGWGTGEPVLTLPLGAATNSPASIIQLPNIATEGATPSTTNSLSLQRYYYKAGLVILVTNFNSTIAGTNCTNVVTTVMLKSSMYDGSPVVFSYTNYAPSNITNSSVSFSNSVRQMATNWTWFGAGNWLTTNATFYDSRQNQTNHVTQIDIGKFGTWIATNTNCIAKWNANNPFNDILYVADMRTTNGMYMDCVRLTNGATIPTNGATAITNGLGTYITNDAYAISGLSVATINPLYIVGNFNTSDNSHCSVVCDALTILSPNWNDANNSSSSSSVQNAASDTVNTAIIAGNVPTTGPGVTQYSGGVHNLTRLLENWGGDTLSLNTSIINLYPSAQATQQFQQPPTYYSAPTRNFTFDTNFFSSTGLPPGTPQVNRMIRADWFTPPPNNVSIQPSPTLAFVPQ